MSLAQHLVRRGAVYYFRRRLPKRAGCGHVFLSLRTRDPARARQLVPCVSAALEELTTLPQAPFLSRAQLDGILRNVVETHLAKLDRLAAAAKSDHGFDARAAERMDQIVGWVYRLLDAQGENAVVTDEDRRDIRSTGLGDNDIEEIEEHLLRLRANGLVPTRHGKLRELLAVQGAAPTAINIAQAQTMYYRAMSLALFQSQSRYRGGGGEDAEFVKAILQQGLADRVAHTSAPPITAPSGMARVPAAPAASAEAQMPPSPDTEASPEHRITVLGEALILDRVKDERWDTKTQEQARQIFALLEKFLAEEHKIQCITSLQQSEFAKFVAFLRHKIYKHYGRSDNYARKTIKQLCANADDKPASLRGIDGGTLNRHLTNIGQLFDYARAQGLPLAADLTTAGVRAKGNKVRARKKRAKMPLAVSQRIFKAPPFVGCAAWDRPYEAGEQIYHRALYFVPMLLEYLGARREEICGLAVDDVILDAPIPHIKIRSNEFRRIKNPQSERDIPLHPEVVRLGFDKYVPAIRALGYRRVFPDLHSPTSASPAGDRFYNEFMPVLKSACEEEGIDVNIVLHSIRHGFNIRLKDEQVHAEERADLLGHAGDSETTERYADAIRLERALDILSKLPIVTAHLQPRPIQLLPWVQAREIAPFSRRRRRRAIPKARRR